MGEADTIIKMASQGGIVLITLGLAVAVFVRWGIPLAERALQAHLSAVDKAEAPPETDRYKPAPPPPPADDKAPAPAPEPEKK